MDTLTDRLKLLRGPKSQADFGAVVNIPQRKLSRIETGKAPIDFESTQNICIALNINADWLLFGRGPMRPGGEEAAAGQESPQARTAFEARIAELEKRVVELEKDVAELEAENKELYKEALNAYKRMYEYMPPDPPNDELDTDVTGSVPSARLTPRSSGE